MDNKKFIKEMMTTLFVEHNVDAADKYVAADYVQHNPNSASGLEPSRIL
jgi:predicted SnoaL-like aldol condensation-catalyzing enzyme